MRCVRAAFAAAVCVAACPVDAWSQGIDGLSFETSIGVLNGKAQEFVYRPDGSDLSRLDWTMDNVPIFSAGVSYDVMPGVTLGARGFTNLDENATMDDFDFDVGSCPPSTPGHTQCHSHHPDTRLQQATGLDLGIAGRILDTGLVRVSALAGYKWDYYKWSAYGGTANYFTTSGPELVISYEQWWEAPYVGLAVEGSWGAFGLDGRVIGSRWARGRDRDHHHLRSLVFHEEFGSSNMLAADLNASYRLSPAVSLTLGYQYQLWDIAKGSTTIEDLFFDAIHVIGGDAAGGSAETHSVSLGARIDLSAAQAAGGLAIVGSSAADWSGLYAGVSAGGAWANADWTTTSLLSPPEVPIAPDATTAEVSLDQTAPLVAGFVGYNWRAGSLLAGLEADVGHAKHHRYSIGIPGTGSASYLLTTADGIAIETGWHGSLRLRVGGNLTPGLLAYATGGLALAETTAIVSCASWPTVTWCMAGPDLDEARQTRLGWTAGAGLEALIGDDWFVRGEYRYTDLGTADHTHLAPIDAVSATTDLVTQQVTVGVGYRF